MGKALYNSNYQKTQQTTTAEGGIPIGWTRSRYRKIQQTRQLRVALYDREPWIDRKCPADKGY